MQKVTKGAIVLDSRNAAAFFHIHLRLCVLVQVAVQRPAFAWKFVETILIHV